MKTFILRTILIITLFFTIIDVYSQPTPTDSLYRKVEAFGQALPQEKVYLHLDNTCYFIGDTIWYKGYVTQSNTGTLTTLSRILYVELLTPDGYLVERQQLEMPDGMAHGMFVLTDSLYAGYYELRAYTRWMLNFELCEYPHVKNTEDNFYSKKMAKEFFRDYEKLYSRVFPVFDKPEVAGEYPKDMTLRPMRRYYKKPRERKPELDLHFYPEGGNLVEGTTARVALELNDEDGQHLKDMLLSIEDKDGLEVTQCKTDERGRAVFTLPEVAKEKDFHAVFAFEGYDFREELPEVESAGCALTVVQDDSTVTARVQAVGVARQLALHVMHQGVSRFYRTLEHKGIQQGAQEEYCVAIPLDSLPTGVNQLTVFDAEGRIYADRLFFVNHHEHDAPRLSISGIKMQYKPFDPITLHLKLTDPADTIAGLSLAVRDRATEEYHYDNGTMLTEMLLASEIRGFVENPGYYFEADDSIRRRALDLLMMVQGWRRYEWRVMAGVEPLDLPWMPEKFQTIAGCVNRAENYNPDFKKPSNLRKEVNVWAMFIQDGQTLELKQPTENGTFYMQTPKIYGDCMLFLSAAGLDKGTEDIIKSRQKGLTDEEAWPEYYVKLDHFHPRFPKPYDFYQDTPTKDLIPVDGRGDSLVQESFTDRTLPSLAVYAKRGGLRHYDPTKPAIVVDAYEAYNMVADAGINGGDRPFYHILYRPEDQYVTRENGHPKRWNVFSSMLGMLYVADMDMHRQYHIESRLDGKSLELPTNMLGGAQTQEKYKKLSFLDKFYIYTDYSPRERGSWKYEQDNQPEFIVDYRLKPNDEYTPASRDRRYLMRGYAVCDDFYSPNYRRRPLPDTKDYRRTLLWVPEVKFNAEGKAIVQLYNNSKQTAISIEAEGITRNGKPVVWNGKNAVQDHADDTSDTAETDHGAEETGTDILYHNVRNAGTALPQEKVYLHLDNTCYFLGDTIWYKGYVTRTDRGTLTDMSKILYVDLFTPDGYLVERQQLEMTDGTAHGMFVLQDTLYGGYYELRAYTRWMLNFGQCEYPHIKETENRFYSLKMAKEFFRDYEKLYSRVFPVFNKVESAGLYSKNMTMRPLRRIYRKRGRRPKTDLHFYPEGGNLVAGTDGRVALELNTDEGEHLPGVDISILNRYEQTVARCRTDARGRTAFTLSDVDKEGGYEAVYRIGRYEYTEDLPEVDRQGCALTVVQNDTAVEARMQAVDVGQPLALHVMSQGVSRFYQPLPALSGKRTVAIPLDSLPTGVNQLTVFDADGRIYADRLFFVNHHDHDAPRLAVSGIRTQYAPFDSITLHLQLADPADSVAGLSLSVRDRATDELTYDNGTMLTEMLLSSEIRGFVENPGYYFEADDDQRRHELDLLMMVQGWRRYEWREMAGVETIYLPWQPEKFQTIAGCVNRLAETAPGSMTASNLGKEVNVWTIFAQGKETFELKQETENGTFYMQTPKIYGEYLLYLSAADLNKDENYIIQRRQQGFTDEKAWPDYYVKLDHFHPLFAHPYDFYQDAPALDPGLFTAGWGGTASFSNRYLSAVTVRARGRGLRKLALQKPAIVMDVNKAYNLCMDYGLCHTPYYYSSGPLMSDFLSSLFIGDMNMNRRYSIRTYFDGRPVSPKQHNDFYPLNLPEGIPLVRVEVPATPLISYQKAENSKYISRLMDFRIYTDYAPRDMGSWKYTQDNQPTVIVDHRFRQNNTYFPACRDRRYFLQGYAVCEDFYSPDYSRRPLPGTQDYRRTLLWMPDVKFDKEGKATVRLYNNSKQTVISVEAEGITQGGKPIVWKKQD